MWYYWVGLLLWLGEGGVPRTLGRLTSVYALLAAIILAESLHPQLFKDTPKTEILENILHIGYSYSSVLPSSEWNLKKTSEQHVVRAYNDDNRTNKCGAFMDATIKPPPQSQISLGEFFTGRKHMGHPWRLWLRNRP